MLNVRSMVLKRTSSELFRSVMFYLSNSIGKPVLVFLFYFFI